MINENWIFLGAALNLIGSLNYVYNTIKGKTKPNRVTWFLWALAPLVAFAAMLSEGISWKIALMTFMVGFGPLMIFIASFVNKNSVWKLTSFDIACGGLSLLGIACWFIFRAGEIAIVFSILADGLALLPTLVKAWSKPETESPLVFFNGAVSAVITMLTIKSWTLASAGFTVYIFIACALMFVVIWFKVGKIFNKYYAKSV